MTPFQVYLWTRLDYIQGFFTACSIFTGIACVILFLIFLVQKYDKENDEYADKIFNSLKKTFVALVLAIVSSVSTPDSKDYALIYILPKLANSEIVGKLPQDVSTLYSIAMDELKRRMITEKEKEK